MYNYYLIINRYNYFNSAEFFQRSKIFLVLKAVVVDKIIVKPPSWKGMKVMYSQHQFNTIKINGTPL